MKITKTLRVFLILLSVMMVLPLFACGDTSEETTTKAPEQTTAPKEETTTDKKVETTEPKADATTAEPEAPATTVAPEEPTEAETTSAETTDATTESGSETTETGSESSETETTEVETTETTAAPECEHVEEAIPAVAPTCTETGLTEGKKCSVCGEILVAQQTVDALGHTEEVVPGKAATCTEDGLTDGKKCSVCNTELVAQQTIPAGHTEETVAGKAATCTEDGLTDGKKCSVCGETITAQTVIPAIAHANKIDKAFTAPTTAEEGWYAHTVCPDCGKVWDAKGEELDAVPTIAKIVPTTNVYLGVAELKDRVVSGNPVDGNPSQFNPAEVSADRTFVRFSRAGAAEDGNLMLLEGNTEVTGKFVVIKYRTNTSTSGEFWANTTDNGHSGGKANYGASFINDDKWHILITDLSQMISSYVQADDEGNYTIQWSRIDLLNSRGDSGYFDIAYVAYCDDLSKVASIMQEGDTALCPHYAAETPVYTVENEAQHSTACVVCGGKKLENHYAASGVVWSTEDKCYTGTCACGTEVVSDMIYKTEPYFAADSAGNFLTASKEDGFTRYTAGKTDKTDLYFFPYRHGTAVTGKYMVIKYRVSNNGVDLATGQRFASSAASGGKPGDPGANENFVVADKWIADGNWHTMLIYPKEANVTFTPNADGTYSWGNLRLNINGITEGGYVDIAEIAFADNQEAAEYYAHQNDANPPFLYNYDATNNFIDGVALFEKNQQNYGCLTVDMSGKTLTTPTSLELGGWVCTPGGVATYYIRVTKIDGEAVEAPALVKWQDGATRADLVDPIIKPRGIAEAAKVGAGFAKSVVDLTAWAGHTIDFELVAVTNYGATVAFGNFLNVAVPAAQAE